MTMVLAAIGLALVVGLVTGGRLSGLANNRVRWPGLAMGGLLLQLLPVRGRELSMALLYLSFGVLLVFAVANLRRPGFGLILAGVALNLTVIAINHGMPVSPQALGASGQGNTLQLLLHSGGAKHHLAGPGDHLLFLGDVIALRPLHQVISVGDAFTYGGVGWLVVTALHSPSAKQAVATRGQVPSVLD